MKNIYNILSMLLVVVLLSACDNDIKDIAKVQEKLELTADSYDIALDMNNPEKVILNINWTEARKTSEDNLVSYTTKLDVVGNGFGATTAIINTEEKGVFSKSFTSEELYLLVTEKWKTPLDKPLQIEFRVLVQWNGGTVFESPEVRTITINIAALN